MSKESYARGFCKAAQAYGVDPVDLIKYAQSGPNGAGPLKSTLKSMTPEVVLNRIRANADPISFWDKWFNKAYRRNPANYPGRMTWGLNDNGDFVAETIPSRRLRAEASVRNAHPDWDAARVRKETNWLLEGDPVGGKPWGASPSYANDRLYPAEQLERMAKPLEKAKNPRVVPTHEVVVPRAKMPKSPGITPFAGNANRLKALSIFSRLFRRK